MPLDSPLEADPRNAKTGPGQAAPGC